MTHDLTRAQRGQVVPAPPSSERRCCRCRDVRFFVSMSRRFGVKSEDFKDSYQSMRMLLRIISAAISAEFEAR